MRDKVHQRTTLYSQSKEDLIDYIMALEANNDFIRNKLKQCGNEINNLFNLFKQLNEEVESKRKVVKE